VDVLSDQVVLINNGYILAEGAVGGMRDEMQEHPLQIMIRCDQASELAAKLFAAGEIVEAALHEDRHGVFIKTRNAETFYSLLNRVVVESGMNIETVTPVDDDLSAVYHYLIGAGGQA
jgi:ABC-2 type transport system ATP-binding protein